MAAGIRATGRTTLELLKADVFSEIKRLGKGRQEAVASRAAPLLTQLTRDFYDSDFTVYEDPRPSSELTGEHLTLKGPAQRTYSSLSYVSLGTQLRVSFNTNYAKYLIGKYEILPNGYMPRAWVTKIREVLDSVNEDWRNNPGRL